MFARRSVAQVYVYISYLVISFIQNATIVYLQMSKYRVSCLLVYQNETWLSFEITVSCIWVYVGVFLVQSNTKSHPQKNIPSILNH